MPLFECDKCGCIENTACTTHYWGCSDKLCSECDTGKWHDRFEKQSAKGLYVDNQGFLWSQRDVDRERNSYDIVGEVE